MLTYFPTLTTQPFRPLFSTCLVMIWGNSLDFRNTRKHCSTKYIISKYLTVCIYIGEVVLMAPTSRVEDDIAVQADSQRLIHIIFNTTWLTVGSMAGENLKHFSHVFLFAWCLLYYLFFFLYVYSLILYIQRVYKSVYYNMKLIIKTVTTEIMISIYR